jgi:hypothetical protein
MADEHDTVSDRRKALGEPFRCVRWTIKVPEVFNLVGIEPRFDVREQAVVDLQVRLQAAHEFKHGDAEALAHPFIRVKAQANVVIAPYTYGLDFLK